MQRWVAYVFALISIVACGSSVSGCVRTLTPAQLEALGKHSFRGSNRAEVVKASETALRTLGYEVVVANSETGQVKTAPKPLVVTAAGTATTAIAVSNDLAWVLEIAPSPEGATMQAIPRGRQGGQAYEGPMNADYMEKAMADLFKEIESNLPRATTASVSGPTAKAR